MIKKLFYAMMAGAMLLATSCEKGLDEVATVNETATVSFNIGTPEIATRAYGDGTTADQLQWAVYDIDGNNYNYLDGIDYEVKTIENGSATVELELGTGNTYQVVFWAAAENAPYTFNPADKTISVNYNNDNFKANDENLDAFYASVEVQVSGAESKTVELTRPFAQLNIGANDYDNAGKAGIVPTSSMIKTYAYPAMDLITGEVIGEEAQQVIFGSNFIANGLTAGVEEEEFKVSGNKYLAMAYLLVGEKETVDVEFSYKSGNKEFKRTVGSVPVERNYRTNIYGKLLTSSADVTIEIKPDFGDDDINVEPWDGTTITKPAADKINDDTKEVTVSGAAELAYFAALVNGTLPETRSAEDNKLKTYTFKLESDINLNNKEWTPIGMGKNLSAGETFRGTFDGQGHTIYGLKVEQQDVAGLFGYVYGATIKNVTIDTATIKSNHYAGGIVAWVNNNTGNLQVPMIIENCHVKNSTITSAAEFVNNEWDNGDKVGGIVGYADYGTADYAPNQGAVISGCSVEKTVIKAYRDFAGIAGYATYLTIESCDVQDVTFEWDNTNNYKNYADVKAANQGDMIGRDGGNNVVDGLDYVTYGVGKDAEGNYHVSNAAGMKWIASVVNSTTPYTPTLFDKVTVYLENDIDLKNEEWIPIGDDRSQRTEWHGVFDGQNYTVKNVKITKKTDREDENKSSYGLFGNVKGTVKNLTVENVSISGAPKFIGALIGRLNDGLVENCHVKNSSVTCNNWTIGGVIGQWNNGKISGCTIENSTIEGYAGVGAVVGLALSSGERTIENCVATNCTIKKNGSFGGDFDKMFGSIVGASYSGTLTVNINNCTSDNTDYSICGYASEGDKVFVDGQQLVFNADDLASAVKAGGEVNILNNITLKESISISNANFSLNGNGHTITMAEDATNTYALFDVTGGKVSFENIVFDGIKEGAVIRTVGVEFNATNVTAKNGVHTQIQGLFRLLGKNTISNCTFEDNTCNMVISLNFDGANNDPQVVENCKFTNNTCNATAALYYVKGAGATITGNEFVGNTVNCSGNGATVYMGFQENCVVTNNLFQNNTVNESTDSSRVAGGIFFGYAMEFTGNRFIGNTATGENVKAQDVCVSTYYTDINLSGNYWGGEAPVEDVNYFVQHKSDERKVIINDYLTE